MDNQYNIHLERGGAMKFQNIITVNGKEIDMKELDEKQRCEIIHRLNSTALGHLHYVETNEKTA